MSRPAVLGVLRDSFYRNSLLLILNYGLVGGLAFVFWAVAARLFPADEIGNVAALFAGVTFVSIAAGLGFQNTVVRYLAGEPDQRSFLLGAMTLVGTTAAVLVVLVLAVPGHLGLPVVGRHGPVGDVVVAAMTVLLTVATVADAAMIGFRATGTIVVKNVVAGLARMALLPFVAGTGEGGLLACLALAAVVASTGSLVVCLRRARGHDAGLRPRAALAGKAGFSAGNHVATLLSSGPLFVLPTYVVHVLGSDQAAYLAACLNLLMALNAVPTTVSQSLFAELASRPAERLAMVMRAFRTVYAILVPLVALLCLLAGVILGLFGGAYPSAAPCLRLMALGAVFGGFNYVADVVLNAAGKVTAFTVVNVVGALAVIGLVAGLGRLDLTWLGAGWLAGQVVYTVIVSVALVRTGVLRAVTPSLSRS